MGDHFALLVDRMLTESTLEAAIRSKNHVQCASSSSSEDVITDFTSHRMDIDEGSSRKELVECRICHDEDEDSNMETPCSCCGSLKYAHRKCVQRWCNEKGDTICEICQQQFKPGYTAPPPLFHSGGIPMNFRGNWEISRRHPHNPQFIAMVSTDHNFLDPDFDEYILPTPRSLMCCRMVAIIQMMKYLIIFLTRGNFQLNMQFMLLLMLRHILPILIASSGEHSATLFMLLMLRTIGIVFPIYVMVKAVTALQRRRRLQGSADSPNLAENEGNELLEEPQPHLIQVW